MIIPGIIASRFTPQGDYESIATVTVGAGGASEINFTSIASTYQHLQIRAVARDNRAVTFNISLMRFNGDTGNNYAYHQLIGNGSTASAGAASSQSFMIPTYHSGSSSGSNIFGAAIIDILDYANTNKNKTIRSLAGVDNNGSGEVRFFSGLWMNTAAVNAIRIFPDTGSFVQNTHFALYGIKG